MKIAVSGAHCTGKTTLVEALDQQNLDYLCQDEPYYLLEAAGHLFPETPGLEDYELQLECSIEQISNSDNNIIFDRCPIDFIAYMMAHPDFSDSDLNIWYSRIQEALDQLDLLVLVPIEDPDLIICPEWENPELRWRVNEELEYIILNQVFDFKMQIIKANGSIQERLQQVMAYVRDAGNNDVE